MQTDMPVCIRPVEPAAIAAMAGIRARERESEAYWKPRITAYLSGGIRPNRLRRRDCDGELQWINVLAEKRGRGIAGLLLEAMAAWFVEQKAYRVCAEVSENRAARKLHAKFGARPLNPHWMVREGVRQVRLFP